MRTPSVPGLGLIQSVAYRVSSTSRESMTMRSDPFFAALFIGTDKTLCSSVTFVDIVIMQGEFSRSHIGLVAAL